MTKPEKFIWISIEVKYPGDKVAERKEKKLEKCCCFELKKVFCNCKLSRTMKGGTKFGPKAGEDTATRTILNKLLVLVPMYYVCFYIVSCIVTAAFGAVIDGTEPFDFVNCDPSLGGRPAGTSVLIVDQDVGLLLCVAHCSFIWSFSLLYSLS